jgi:hypothetical protein
VLLIECATAQTPPFSSGSTGADGALTYTTPGTYYFNPKAANPPLNPAGDNIFNFTTINIAAGVRLKLSSIYLTGPVVWLASGDVTINGVIDLDGEPGNGNGSSNQSDRVPNSAGAGGFSGGIGGKFGTQFPPLPGNGPGGGAAESRANPTDVGGGKFTGNQYLVPLIGGSGGGGSGCNLCTGNGTAFGAGGGAGGGAILIASSTSIIFGTGSIITAKGADGLVACGCQSGGGGGGSIRLVANSIRGGPVTLTAAGGYAYMGGAAIAANGAIRVEGESAALNYNADPTLPFLRSAPFALALPVSPPSSIKVTTINGITVNANPFTFPDVTLNAAGGVTVNVQAQYIPVGTIPKIMVFSETGPDQTVSCSALAGTLQLSTCSATITFPTGGSRGFVKATWTQ